MNQANQLATATGSMGLVSALSVAIQWLLTYFGMTINAEQAGAVSVLLYPFVHLVFIRISKRIDKEQQGATP